MRSIAPRLLCAAGLLLAVGATAVAVRAWLGERSFAAGAAAQRRGEFSAAAAAYRAASDHGNADAASARVRLELLRREWPQAAESLREALALAPTRGLPQILQARLEIERPGPWDGAREERILSACRRAVVLEPGQGAAWSEAAAAMYTLAALRREQWDAARSRAVLAEAADGFAKALALEPATVPALFARVFEAGADPVFAFDVAARRGAAAVFAALVKLLLDRSLWEGSETELWAAAAERGALPAFSAVLADALVRRGRIKEALAAARRGLSAAPRDVASVVRAADIAAKLPGPEALEAVPLYREALALVPSDLPIRKRFASFLAARKLFSEAEIEARILVTADTKDDQSWFLLGQIARFSGRPADAAAAYRQAASLRPQNAAYRRFAAGTP